jgi:aspartate racemase
MARKTIGILGGMGPEATGKLFQEIVSATPASKDQEHIPIVVYNNPGIPDRTNAILYGGENPVPEIVKAGKRLEFSGADFIVIPCNTSHYFFNEIQEHLDIPVLNMIEETASFIKRNYPDSMKVGLLATTGTVKSGIYLNVLAKKGIDVITPKDLVQEKYVMEAIYGKKGIKAGYKLKPKDLLKMAAQSLIDMGADIIIAGCTEIPLVLKQNSVGFIVIDPSKILAEAAVEKALAEEEAVSEQFVAFERLEAIEEEEEE